MPSRKKAKGKALALKAAKEAAEDKDESQVIAANQRPLGLLDVMQHDLFEVLQRMRNDAETTAWGVRYFQLPQRRKKNMLSGTKCILNGDNHTASLYAILISYFEQWKTVKVRKTKATFSWTNAFELNDADDHTLVQYFRKRIPCACLQEKYTEVKSIKKMGWCYNTKCSLPGRKVQRSKMLYCTRCCDANYCSIECQKADWKRHRSDCDRAVETKAKQS
eukprot:scaffold224_cov108-Skeletonema_marinoi.AAC.17